MRRPRAGAAGRGLVLGVSRGCSVCRGDLCDGGPGGGVVDEVLPGAGGGDQGGGADVVDGAGLAAGGLVDLATASSVNSSAVRPACSRWWRMYPAVSSGVMPFIWYLTVIRCLSAASAVAAYVCPVSSGQAGRPRVPCAGWPGHTGGYGWPRAST